MPLFEFALTPLYTVHYSLSILWVPRAVGQPASRGSYRILRHLETHFFSVYYYMIGLLVYLVFDFRSRRSGRLTSLYLSLWFRCKGVPVSPRHPDGFM